jgi:hypothetical protein
MACSPIWLDQIGAAGLQITDSASPAPLLLSFIAED